MFSPCLRRPTALAIVVAAACAGPASAGCEARRSISHEVAGKLEAAASLIVEQAKRGDTEAVRANAAAALKEKFDDTAAMLRNQRAALSGTLALRAMYVLSPTKDGRYECGASQTGPAEAEFVLPDLPPGKYAIVIGNVGAPSAPLHLTALFQYDSGWRLSKLFLRPKTSQGHDAAWFAGRARQFAASRERLNAWFYFVIAWDLTAAVPFMDSPELSSLAKEAAAWRPADAPAPGKSVTITANGKSLHVTEMSVLRAKDGLHWIARYEVPSVDDLPEILADSRALADELMRKHPEASKAFDVLSVHAVDGKGGDVAVPVSLAPGGAR